MQLKIAVRREINIESAERKHVILQFDIISQKTCNCTTIITIVKLIQRIKHCVGLYIQNQIALLFPRIEEISQCTTGARARRLSCNFVRIGSHGRVSRF